MRRALLVGGKYAWGLLVILAVTSWAAALFRECSFLDVAWWSFVMFFAGLFSGLRMLAWMIDRGWMKYRRVEQ